MEQLRFFELRDRCERLREQFQSRCGQSIPSSIIILEDELTRESDPNNRFDLYLLLRSECYETGMRKLEVETAWKIVAEYPDDPLAWITVAEVLARASETIG